MAARYWVGGGSSNAWNATGNTNWSATSGGSNNASVPGSGDDVYFDANSGTGTAANTAGIVIRSINLNGYAGTISGTAYIQIQTANSDLTSNGATWSLTGQLRINANINLNGGGQSIASTLRILTGKTCTLTGNLTITNVVSVLVDSTSGVLDTNGYNITATGRMEVGNGSTFYARTGSHKFNALNTSTVYSSNYYFNSATMQLTGGTPIGDLSSIGTWDTGTAVFNITNTSTTVALNLQGKTYNTLNVTTGTNLINLTGGGATVSTTYFGSGSGTLNVLDSNNFGALSVGASRVVKFTAGTTTTVSSFSTSGTSGSNTTLNSSSDGSTWTITDSGGTNTVTYTKIKDSIATGGATWNAYDGTNTDQGNNTGWMFQNLSNFITIISD